MVLTRNQLKTVVVGNKMTESTTSTDNKNSNCTTEDDETIFVKRGYCVGKISSSSDHHHDEDADMWIPCVETSSTSSPSSDSSSNNCDFQEISSVSIEANQLLASPSSSTLTASPSSSNKKSVHNNKQDSTNKQRNNDDVYISKEDLNLIMLTPDSYEQYQSFVQDERDQKSLDCPIRKTLIQQELDTLLRLVEENDELDGRELEPEAEEALGIAADTVCYLQKYYDEDRSEYVFVPSVAYAIMNGTLLEEASKHYYGESEEFLVTYAASLGSAVLSQKNYKEYMNVGRSELKFEEDSKIESDPNSYNGMNHHRNENVSDLFLGVVSPRNTTTAITQAEEKTQEKKQIKPIKVKQVKVTKMIFAVALFCALLGSYILSMDHLSLSFFQLTTIEKLQEAPQTLKQIRRALPSSMEVHGKKPEEETTTESSMKLVVSSLSSSTESEPTLKIDESISPKPKQERKRPIAVNLLYHH
jgi:hypothetical protein